MLPTPSRNLLAFDPVAERAQFQRRTIAARRAQAGTDTTGRVRPPVGSSRRVQMAEEQLANEQRAAAEELRRHKAYELQRSSAPLILPKTPITAEGEADESVNAEMQRYGVYEQAAIDEARMAQSMDLVDGARARMAAVQQAKAEAVRRSTADQKPIIDTNAISSYTLSFLSFIGMPGVDVGASYTTGSSGTMYKLFMSGAKFFGYEFPEKLERIPFVPKAPHPFEDPSGMAKVAAYLFILFWLPILFALICSLLYFLIDGIL